MNFTKILKILDLFLRWYVAGGGKKILREWAQKTDPKWDDELLNTIDKFIDGK